MYFFILKEDRRGDDHSLDRVSGEAGRENGPDKGGGGSALQRPPSRSGSSSSRSTPKSKDVSSIISNSIGELSNTCT